MLFIKKYYPKYLLILSLVASTGMFRSEVYGKEKNTGYQESVYLHLCRNTFVTGEIIWYRAYCFANDDPKANFLSKPLYVEMLNNKNKQVLGQTVKIISGTAASSIRIPDTLSSGLYQIRAYTQWMRNAGPDCFFSCPVYIYNEFDDENNKKGLQVGINPDIFIEGGKIVNEIPVKIYMDKILSSDAHNIFIYNTATNQKITEFNHAMNGRLEADFVPSDTAIYEVLIGDTLHPATKIMLPQVERIGAQIDVLHVTDKSVVLRIITNPVSARDCILSAWSGGSVITRKSINKENINNEISLSMPVFMNKSIDFILQTINDNVLAKKTFIFSTKTIEKPENIMVYKRRSKVTVDAGNLPFSLDPGSHFSISVHKDASSLFAGNDILDYETRTCQIGAHLLVNSDKGWSEIVPALNNDQESGNYNEIANKTEHTNKVFPVEEKGIVVTGKVLNPATGNPLTDVDVLLAIKDTFPEIQSYHTDSLGQFVFLLGNTSKSEAVVRLFKKEQYLPGKYTILFDSKYEASPEPKKYALNYAFDSNFIEKIKNEAQREKIIKAFAPTGQPIVVPPDNNHKWKFYGIPELTVYPGEFIMLPNFEEISREIVPKVKYRKNRNGCSIAVYSDLESVYLTTPLVLLDGIPVTDLCDIYPLNSDDVYKIDVQSSRRVSGNMMYDGLVAIYTTPARSKAIDEKIRPELIQIPHYYQGPTFEQVKKKEVSDSTSKRPEFLNQLYWNPSFDGGQKSSRGFEFNTSDEEGEYVIDIQGVESNGSVIHYQRKFKVED